jgi:hypothetical protein
MLPTTSRHVATRGALGCAPWEAMGTSRLSPVYSNGNEHNVGNLFNLAAQTRANQLNAQGHRVIACRVSSVQDVLSEFTQNGLIDGGVIYFGHSGLRAFAHNAEGVITDASSEIFVPQLSGADTNIATNNAEMLADVRKARCSDSTDPQCNSVGPNAAILINGCDAGYLILDHYVHRFTSIAHEIAGQTHRGVYAYDVGVYFSHLDAAHDPFVDGKIPNTQKSRQVSGTLPIYMIPEGAPSHKHLRCLGEKGEKNQL